ncbi:MULTISPECIES: hypothetical protein [Rhodobacterales]|uniref:hypothetical protein n=1 Tax=Rhodobacterales TaxID=204455 RepID=UPI0006C88C0A|nr:MULTISPECIES: hypothetical protein [Rhodobacterales]KPD13482.1 hypothetical protein AN476_04635 [Phaeobacter sp. 11ANDIMAR09]OIQ35015.1 MAG: hypothetical protein BM559_03410 [Roseobacter sp. MedPE-SWchi]
MRDLFIGLFDKLVGVFVILLCIGVLAGTAGAFLAPAPNGGLLPALAVFVIGSIYAILMGGMMYLFLGVYHNTKRTAEAIEELARR